MAYTRNRQDASLHLMSDLVDSILRIEIALSQPWAFYTQSVNLNQKKYMKEYIYQGVSICHSKTPSVANG